MSPTTQTPTPIYWIPVGVYASAPVEVDSSTYYPGNSLPQIQTAFYWTPMGVYPSSHVIMPVEVAGMTYYYPGNSLAAAQDGTTYFPQRANAYHLPLATVWNGTTFYTPPRPPVVAPAPKVLIRITKPKD